MATAVASALTKRAIRRDVAMTGEITLRGRVLPIGGLKEKSLAAKRAGITTILIPKDNEKDLQDMPEEVMKGITFIPVENMDQVLANALVPMETATEAVPKAKTPRKKPVAKNEDQK